MTDDQKREIVERVARKEYETQVARVLDTRIGPHPKWENLSFESRQSRMWLTKCYLQAADYFELRAAVEKAVEELAARARIDNYPAVVADGYVVRMLRAALKGGGESDT